MKRTIWETKTNIVQWLINKLTDTEKGELSDGYHTFNELYEHRQTLFVTYCNMVFALMKTLKTSTAGVWKSKLHHDWTMFDWMFIAGTWEKSWQYITYHLDMKYRDCFVWAEVNNAPERDWHTSEDVLKRLFGWKHPALLTPDSLLPTK